MSVPAPGVIPATGHVSHAAHPSRSSATRLVHFILLLVIVHQLVGSSFIRLPFPGDPPSWLFAMHEYVGLGALWVVGVFWVWVLVRHGETRLDRLVPWFSPARIRDVLGDLRDQLMQLARFQIPDEGNGALASAVHGLGLLTATGLAVSGAMYFFTHGTPIGHAWLTLHRGVANLMWAYLIGHASLAVLHHMAGSDIFSRMFLAPRRAVRHWRTR
jgi:hypothetical protein